MVKPYSEEANYVILIDVPLMQIIVFFPTHVTHMRKVLCTCIRLVISGTPMLKCFNAHSRISIARTPMARSPWLIPTRFESLRNSYDR